MRTNGIVAVEYIRLWHVRVPLRAPYHLSFGTLSSFDTVLAAMGTSDGNLFWGESTPLPGYSPETVDEVWRYSCVAAEQIVGLTVEEAERALLARVDGKGFLRSALSTALDQLLWETEKGGWGQLYRNLHAPIRIPIVATVDSTAVASAVRGARVATRQGYDTIKVKVALPGRSVADDLDLLREVRGSIGGQVRIRVDANQGYDVDEATGFIDGVQDLDLELLEQPYAPDRWDDMARLYQRRGNLPLMLDEAISSPEDIVRCSTLRCADLVKLKVMKAGGLRATADMVGAARAEGLDVILGNGVQTDVGCVLEARVHALLGLQRAGEENGFLKLSASLMEAPIQQDGGTMTVGALDVNMEHLEKVVVRSHAVER